MNSATNSQLASQLDLPEQAINEAMEWLVLSWSGETDHDFEQALNAWLQENQENQQAWLHLKCMSGKIDKVPGKIASKSLRTADKAGSRRRFLQVLGMLAFGVTASPLFMRQRFVQSSLADLSTTTGEINSHVLEDGTRLIMNTSTAVNLNYSPTQRRLKLITGEIQITTAQDLKGRPFTVETSHGFVRPVGTVFTVRQTDQNTQVQVLEGAVKVQTLNKKQLSISAGKAAGFDATKLLPGVNSNPEWVTGKLKAKQISLAAFFSELERYRPGIIRVHPDIAALKITGRFDLKNTDRTLSLVEKALPIKVQYISSYWVNITPE